MATLKTNTLTGTSTAGSIAVTGEGNSTTTNLQQGLCKIWVHFTGITTTAIRDSFNVTSLTDTATGKTTVNFNNDFSNDDWAGTMYTNAATGTGSTDWANQYHGGLVIRTTGSCLHSAYSTGDIDSSLNDVSIHGDLA